jgi:hypothetical protein
MFCCVFGDACLRPVSCVANVISFFEFSILDYLPLFSLTFMPNATILTKESYRQENATNHYGYCK